jgi:hypothetical protein
LSRTASVNAPRRRVVDRPGDQLLACPALAEDQHRRARRRHPLDHLAQPLHHVAIADQRGRRDDRRSPRQHRNVAQRQHQRQLVERIGHDVIDPGREQRHRERRIARPHHRDHRRRPAGAHQLRGELTGSEHRITLVSCAQVAARAVELGHRGHLLARAIEHHVQRTARVVIGPQQEDVMHRR